MDNKEHEKYTRVYLGDGTYIDTTEPPSLWRRLIGFSLIFLLTIWPIPLCVVTILLLHIIK